MGTVVKLGLPRIVIKTGLCSSIKIISVPPMPAAYVAEAPPSSVSTIPNFCVCANVFCNSSYDKAVPTLLLANMLAERKIFCHANQL